MSATLHRTEGSSWESLYRRMRNVAAGYSNYCEESGSTRKLEREFEQIDDDARGIALAVLVEATTSAPSGWISIEERLPELGVSIALLKADGWENTGSDLEMNIRACGYLADGGPFRYWAIRGERATELKYFTHWMPLPPAPNQGEAS